MNSPWRPPPSREEGRARARDSTPPPPRFIIEKAAPTTQYVIRGPFVFDRVAKVIHSLFAGVSPASRRFLPDDTGDENEARANDKQYPSPKNCRKRKARPPDGLSLLRIFVRAHARTRVYLAWFFASSHHVDLCLSLSLSLSLSLVLSSSSAILSRPAPTPPFSRALFERVVRTSHTRARGSPSPPHRAIKKQLYAAPPQSRDRRRAACRNVILVIQERDTTDVRIMYMYACPSVHPLVHSLVHATTSCAHIIVVAWCWSSHFLNRARTFCDAVQRNDLGCVPFYRWDADGVLF